MKKKHYFFQLLLLLACLMADVNSAWGEDKTVTFAYSDYKGKGTSSSGSEFTMEKDDVSIKNTNFYGNNSYAQFYANGTTTIMPGDGVTISKIVLTAYSSSYNGYQSGGSLTASAGTVSGSNTTVTWKGSAAASFTITNNKQIRWTSIVVTYSKSSSGPFDLTTFAFADTTPSVTLGPGETAAYAATYTQEVTVSPDSYDGTISYSIDAESSTFAGGAFVDSATGEVTITASENVGGTVVVKASGEATVKFNKPADASYTLTVNQLQSYTVTLSDGGTVSGATVTLPARENIDDYVFVGWSETDVTEQTSERPSIIPAGEYSPTADITLYPVYAIEETSGESVEEWVEITNVPEDGTYAICSSSYFMSSTVTSNRFANGGTAPWIVDGKLKEAPKENCVWEIYKASDNYFRIKTGSSYAAATGSNNQGELVDDESSNYAKWTITFGNGFTVENVGMAAAKKNKTLRNNGTYGWGTYGATTGSAPRLFKKSDVAVVTTYYYSHPVADSREEANLSFATAAVTAELMSDYSGQALLNPSNVAPITWASSNEEVATVEDGIVTVLAVGTTTITATFAGDGSYKQGVASYTLTVQDSRPALTLSFTPETLALNVGATAELPTLNGNTGNGEVTYASSDESIAAISGDGVTSAFQVVAGQTEGTATITATVAETSSYQGGTASFTVTVTDPNRKGSLANPYTVAEALANTPSDGVYVRGVVSSFTSKGVYSDRYHRYSVSDDGTVQSDQLLIFNGKGLNNEAFTSDDDVQLGDVVIIYGNLSLYGKTKEMDEGNYIVSLKRKVDAGLAYETTAFATFPGDADFVAPILTNPHQLTVSYASSNVDVAYVDEHTGEVLLGDVEGKATITATFAGNDDYKAATASYTITLKKLEAGLAYEDTEFEVRVNDEFTAPTLTNPNQLAVTYASSDEDVALVDEQTGEVVIGSAGVATITATFAGNTKFNAGTASYTITVVAGKLTAEIVLAAESVSMNAGTTKELSTLYTTNSDGEVSYESSNSDYVSISDGMLVAVQPTTGAETVTVTITVAESEAYQAVSTTLPVTVTQLADVAAFSPAGGFVKVTATEDIVNGEYLIVNEDAGVAFNGALETLDAVGNIINVEIEDETIEETEATKSATFTINTANGYVKAKSGKFIGVSSYSNGLTASDTGVGHGFKIDDDHNAVLTVSTSGGSMTLRYNTATDQNRFRYYKSGQEPIQLYRLQNPELTIGSAQWRTLVSSACLQFPDEVSAYIVTSVGEYVTLRRVRRVKAGVPVVLNAEAGSYTVTAITEDQCEDTSANLLQVSTQREGENVYVLANKSQGVGFYKWTGGWLGKGRVYLPGMSSTNARSFLTLNLNETTAIGSVESEEWSEESEEWSVKGFFNLNGQRVQQPRKGGLYIVNGKKVVVR